MLVLAVLIILSISGIGVVVWLLKSEGKESHNSSSLASELDAITLAKDSTGEQEESPAIPDKPKQKFSLLLSKLASVKKKSGEAADTIPKSKLFSNVLSMLKEKLNFGSKGQKPEYIPDTTPLPSLKEYLAAEKSENNGQQNKKTPPVSEEPKAGTASIKIIPGEEVVTDNGLSDEEEKTIAKELDQSAQLSELKEKYNKLDALLKEKNTELEKAQEFVASEVKNRKEFNKVKDLLEKELKDSKNKSRDIQGELEAAQNEGSRQKKRVGQLEEKTTWLKKDLLEKEDTINDLVKRMQTFASPSTAATPPAKETPKEEEGAAPETKEPQKNNAPPSQPDENNNTGETPAKTELSPPERDEKPKVEGTPVPTKASPEETSIGTEPTPESKPQDDQSSSQPQDDNETAEKPKVAGKPVPIEMITKEILLSEEALIQYEDKEQPSQPDEQPQDNAENTEERKGDIIPERQPEQEGEQKSDEQPQEEEFLKLQPDVLSKDSPGEKQTKQPDQKKKTFNIIEPKPPQDAPSNNQEPNQQDNNNTGKKE